jgi:SAM-dependent methyltransferase
MAKPLRATVDSREALKIICRLNARMSWLHRIEGIDLSRCFEYAKVSELLRPLGSGRVLDVGSYRSPFTAFLADLGYEIVPMDVDPVVGKQRLWVRRALGRGTSLSPCVADGTRQPFPDSVFDVVVCVSAVEHIPGNGDVQAAGEIGRVLKPGGQCFISVPYSPLPKDGQWGRWFQRWYSLTTAAVRLVEPSSLSLSAYGFLMGGMVGKVADAWYTFPRLVRHMLSWSHILVFPEAVRRDAASESDARILWLFLEKR